MKKAYKTILKRPPPVHCEIEGIQIKEIQHHCYPPMEVVLSKNQKNITENHKVSQG